MDRRRKMRAISGAVLLLALSAGLFSCGHSAGNTAIAAMDEEGKDRVIVYYFYGNFRCANCFKIEQHTKEAVGMFFSDETRDGKLRFEALNVDKAENAHFARKYDLYTKSVVLSLVKGGKETKCRNLEKIWEYLGDENAFLDYIRNETEEFLQELR